MGWELLFAYGTLEEALDPPTTLSLDIRDAVPGCLYDLGSAPAAVRLGNKTEGLILGEVEAIHSEELAKLDRREESRAAPGAYKRVRVKTKRGLDVWAYEFNEKMPANAKKIASPARWTPTSKAIMQA